MLSVVITIAARLSQLLLLYLAVRLLFAVIRSFRSAERPVLHGIYSEIRSVGILVPLVTFLALLPIFALALPYNRYAQEVDLRTGDAAPVFRAVTVDGDTIDIRTLRGGMVLLDFWFTSCAPCIEDTHHLRALQAKYNSSLEIIAISVERDANTVKEYARRERLPWVQIIDAHNEDRLAALYRVDRFPTYILLNRDGTIEHQGSRARLLVDREELRSRSAIENVALSLAR